MRVQNLIIGAAMCGSLYAPHASASEARPGVYIGLGAGSNFKLEADIDGANATADYDLGFGAAAAIGYAFRGGPRVELEFSHRQNETDSVNPGAPVPATASFDQTTTATMLNVLYDYHTDFGLIPTIGVGIGVALADTEDLGEDLVFAYQGIAGLGYEIAEGVTAFAEYRFFATQEIENRAFGQNLSIDNFNHTGLIGVRFRLGDPFAKPDLNLSDQYPRSRDVRANAAASSSSLSQQAPARLQTPSSYLVFFEFDQAGLSSAAEAIVRAAATNIRAGQSVRLMVTGHADRAGDTGYNTRLSEERANAVRQFLEREGIAADSIVVMAKGEAEPLVSTNDGLREPQNRRVEIVLN